MRAARAHLLTAATLGLSAPPTIRKVETVGFAVAQAALSRVGSRVVCTHARTHAPARTHAHTRARAHTHTQAHARRRCPYPARQPRARGQGAPPHWASILGLPTSAQGLGSPPPTSALGVNASTTVHLRRDLAQPLPTSAPGLRSATAHICAGTWLSHCPHLRRDCARPLPTSAPRLRSPTAHIVTGLTICPHLGYRASASACVQWCVRCRSVYAKRMRRAYALSMRIRHVAVSHDTLRLCGCVCVCVCVLHVA